MRKIIIIAIAWGVLFTIMVEGYNWYFGDETQTIWRIARTFLVLTVASFTIAYFENRRNKNYSNIA